MEAGEATSLITTEFVGRSRDRDRIRAVLTQLRSGLSAALVLSGDPGVGKTRLLQEMISDAVDIRTILVSGYESEVRLGFAALHRLLHPLLGGLCELPAPQRDALSTAFGLTEGPVPNRFLIGLATMSLLAQAGETLPPLLCVVDDVQWVDQESVDALSFVARRVDAEGVGVIFGLRESARPTSNFAGIPQLRLEPMPDADMRSLLSKAVRASLAPHVATRLVTESEGNPLALLEYAASLSPGRLAGLGTLPPVLPISERLSTRFAAQIDKLPRATQRMLLVLSAVGTEDADFFAETCTRMRIAPGAAQAAIRQALISDLPAPAFRHPLIRSAVYDTADVTERRRVHASIADVAAERGSPDTAAWHKAIAIPGADESIADQLEGSAVRVRERGGYAAEATLLTLAAQRSVEGTEGHSRRLLAAAHAHMIAGNSTQAEALLEKCAVAGNMGARLQVERGRAVLLGYDSRTADAAAVLVGTAKDLPPEDFELAWELHCNALRAAMGSREYTTDTTLQDVARAVLGRSRPPGREPTAGDLIYEGLATRCANSYEAAAPVEKRALHQLRRDPSFATARSLMLLTWLVAEDLLDDEFETATLTEMTASNRAQGVLPSVWMGLAALANAETRHGNFVAAQAMFDEATSTALAIGGVSDQVWPTLVELRAWQGRETEARAMADHLIRVWGRQRRHGSSANFALLGLTVLDLSLRRYAQALEHARTVALDDPPGHGTRILPDLVEAAVRTGDQALAGRVLDEFTARAAVAATPWAMGLLEKSRALALATSPEAEPHYQEALRIFSPTALDTETARTQLLYGEWLRRKRRRADAREQLKDALAAFTGMGAVAFAQRAALELTAAGAKPIVAVAVPPSALTTQERRVAELAAQGMTNSDISQTMFISESTVDYHLSKVFRKLQIESRRRLRDKLGTGEDSAAEAKL